MNARNPRPTKANLTSLVAVVIANALDPTAMADALKPTGTWQIPSRDVCEGDYGPPTETGRLDDPELVESSGVASSLIRSDIVWIHNDSGDTARLFAVRTDGHTVARLTLDSVKAVDFEDIATGPCPDKSGPCLWVADTGNNSHNRTDQTLYAVREPDLRGPNVPRELHASHVWSFPVTFPGPAVDSEALALSPSLDALYLFEKVDRPRARVFRYKAPFIDGRKALLEVVAEIDSPGFPIKYGKMITAAALHPRGDRLVLRVYTGVFEYRFGKGESLANLGKIAPRLVALGPMTEPQGEAVTYDFAGTGIWSVSEDPHQLPGQPLHHYACRK